MKEQVDVSYGLCVVVHSIRVYEQSDDGLLKAEGGTLLSLSRTLECSIEELLG